jgi:hypothetical protein
MPSSKLIVEICRRVDSAAPPTQDDSLMLYVVFKPIHGVLMLDSADSARVLLWSS